MAIIGNIYNKSSFDSLIDFDIKGNWEISGGNLITSGSNSKLQMRYVSALDVFTWKIRSNSSALNIQFFGIKSENNIRLTLSIQSGRAKWSWDYDGSSGLSTGTLAINPGDILEYTFIKNKWSYIFSVKNLTTESEVNVDMSSFVAITAHKLILWSASPLSILSMLKTSNQEFEPLNLLVGDSISYGSAANIPANRWGEKAGFSIEGSSGDTSTESLELLSEIINIIKPKRVIYAFGTNDLNIEVWKSNLQAFKNSVYQKNIVFIPITPYANSNRSMAAYQTYISNNFTEYFDVFSITKQSGNDNLKTEYNSGDNVHPNTVGHTAISDYVLASPYYDFTPIIPQGNAAIYTALIDRWYSNY